MTAIDETIGQRWGEAPRSPSPRSQHNETLSCGQLPSTSPVELHVSEGGELKFPLSILLNRFLLRLAALGGETSGFAKLVCVLVLSMINRLHKKYIYRQENIYCFTFPRFLGEETIGMADVTPLTANRRVARLTSITCPADH